MHILLVGHTGNLGSLVFEYFKNMDDISLVTASRNSGDYHVNIEDTESIRRLFNQVGSVDALISCGGSTVFEPFESLNPELNNQSIESKLKGQVNLALIGKEFVNPKGSITLTSGIIGDECIPMGTSSALVNGAINAFVQSAAFEMPNGIRINSVSPNALETSWASFKDYFKGFKPISDEDICLAYEKAVYGVMNGKVFKVY